MRSPATAPRYFSAYPLKAIQGAIPETPVMPQSPYLRSLLSGHKKSSTLRVYPKDLAANETPTKVTLRLQPVPAVISESKEWFCAYE